MEQLKVETLDYAEAARAVGVPLGGIVGATVAYAGGNWVATLVSDWWYFVGGRELSADPGEAAVQLSLRWEKLSRSMVPETVMIVIAAAVVLCVQWGMWRVWPAERRRVGWLGVGVGIGHCAVMWGVQWVAAEAPLLRGSLWGLAGALLVPAAGIGGGVSVVEGLLRIGRKAQPLKRPRRDGVAGVERGNFQGRGARVTGWLVRRA